MPSGPKASVPPLWFEKGCGARRISVSLAGSAAFGSAAETWKRERTVGCGEPSG